MGDDIEVHWDRDRGLVSLNCGAEAFARIAHRVADDIPLPEGVTVAQIQGIEVYNTPQHAPSQQRWRDRAALLGCTMVGFLLCFIFIAGIAQVITWFRT